VPPRLPPDIINFDRVNTIYRARFRTAVLKIERHETWAFHLDTTTIPPSIEEVLRAAYANLEDDQEHFLLLILNEAREVRGYKVIASGSYHRVTIDLNLVYRNAILFGARAIVCAHNHPNGGLEPSPEDLKLTRLLIRGGKTLQMEMVDHYIYTSRACASIRERHPHLWPASKKTKKGSSKEDIK
jgi:DNA repair protein RadC